jgi:16S rRNA (guanine527-N7)-methyltransferase
VSQALEQELKQGLDRLNLTADDGQAAALISYLQLLKKWNRHFNLFAVDDLSAMVSRHLLDSLSLNAYLHGSRIIDVGTGAGLPGIPLAIMNPTRDFVLIDSNGKKTRFLFQVKIALQLENISIENTRIEHYQNQQQIDMVICRAFSSLEDMVSKSQQLFGKETKLLAMKGRYPQQELQSLPAGFEVNRVIKLDIPESEYQRHLVEVIRE